MSRRASKTELLQLRKDLLKLRLETQRQGLIYHSQPIRKPLAAIAQLKQNPLSTPKSLGLLVSASVLIGLIVPHLGKISRVAQACISLYPLYQAFFSAASSPATRANTGKPSQAPAQTPDPES